VAPADDVRDTVCVLSESQRTHFGHVHARVADAAAACAAAERTRRVSGVRGVETTDDGTLHVEYNRDRTTEAAVRAAIEEVVTDLPGPADA
jgi:tryptophan 2,3-dioxygenase